MELAPTAYYEKLKRCWKRRKYQRLNGEPNDKRKLKMMRLGGNCGRLWRIRAIPKQRLKIVSPIKMLAKFHDAYINMMIHLASNFEKSNNNIGVFGGKRITKNRHVSMVSSGEEVDTKLVMEIYKRLQASNRKFAAF